MLDLDEIEEFRSGFHSNNYEENKIDKICNELSDYINNLYEKTHDVNVYLIKRKLEKIIAKVTGVNK